MPWTLVVRAGPRVERSRFERLEQALDMAEQRGREIALATSKQAVDVRIKRFEPIQQVAARIELAGPERLLPSRRGGIDIRGDGSAEAYRGRVRRQLIEQQRGETPYRALRRVLTQA